MLPKKEPITDKGIGIMCIISRIPESIMVEASFFKNNAITRINTVKIEPVNKPVDIGDEG